MKKIFKVSAAAGISLALAGCVTTSGPLWYGEVQHDRFEDKTRCLVTMGSYYFGSTVYTLSGHFYPYIENTKDGLVFGVKSGGKVQIPVSDVQVRIDDHKAWTITKSETPNDYQPSDYQNYMAAYQATAGNEQAKQAFDTVMKVTSTAMLPYTAVRGEKAVAIVKEMLSGKKIIYRQLALGQNASSVGEVEIDDSLRVALTRCGIDAATL